MPTLPKRPGVAERSDELPGLNWQPPFYRAIEALTANGHQAFFLKPRTDFGFSRNINAVPITDLELARASRIYPIVLQGEPLQPFAVLGQTGNLFVDAQGRWSDEA